VRPRPPGYESGPGDLFAASAPVAFSIPFLDPTVCQPSRPIPVLAFQGTTDQFIPYGDGPTQGSFFSVTSAQASLARWRDVNGCVGAVPNQTLSTGDGVCEFYTACQQGTEVGLCSLVGTAFFGHILYTNSDDLDVGKTAWDFLSRFTLTTQAACATDAECSDGSACNGVETCELGSSTCEPGSPVLCDGACETGFCVDTAGTCEPDLSPAWVPPVPVPGMSSPSGSTTG
jgi:hypothetical protein